MTDANGRPRPARQLPGRAARKRRWARGILLGVAALMALVVLGSWAFIRFQPTSPRLALPTAPASAPAGALDGTWAVSAGSVAGFRVPETAFGLSNDTVGRIAGSIPVAFSAWGIKARRGSASSAPWPTTGWRSSC